MKNEVLKSWTNSVKWDEIQIMLKSWEHVIYASTLKHIAIYISFKIMDWRHVSDMQHQFFIIASEVMTLQ